MTKKSCIIVAGGLGKRMNSQLPKQFIVLKDKPIIFWTIYCFSDFDEIVVVLPREYFDYWKKLCAQYKFDCPVKLAEGGSERFFSVRNGLEAIENNQGIVAIHDGVRPFVSKELLNRGISTAIRFNVAIPYTNVTSSVRIVENDNTNYHIDRQKVKLIQTPQFFNIKMLKDAYKQEFKPIFTDDASVVEYFGEKIFLFEGDENNIKITTQFDLQVANLIIDINNQKT